MSDIVEALLNGVGMYCGSQVDPSDATGAPGSIARILVTAPPGGAGVSMDYELLSADGGRVHAERSTLARTTRGVVLVSAHSHADILTVLSEAEPGYFPAVDGAAPFPWQSVFKFPRPVSYEPTSAQDCCAEHNKIDRVARGAPFVF